MSAESIIYCDFNKMIPEDTRESLKQNEEFYQVECPNCVDNFKYHKLKLYIKKSLEFGWCHHCSYLYIDRFTQYTLPKLKSILSKFFMNESVLDELMRSANIDEYSTARSTPNQVDLDYLIITRENPYIISHLDRLKIRFTSDGMLIPYLDKQDGVFYYVKRIYQPHGGLKYFLPPVRSKPYYIIRRDSTNYVIVEGQLDAIAVSIMYPTMNVIALSGSTFTDKQIQVFKNETNIPDNILVWLDNEFLNNKLIKHLKSKFPYSNYRTFASPNNYDPEEFFKYIYHENTDK